MFMGNLRLQVFTILLARQGLSFTLYRQLGDLHIVSWAIYGAALEWSQRPGGQSAEAFVAEALPLIAASLSALDAH